MGSMPRIGPQDKGFPPMLLDKEITMHFGIMAMQMDALIPPGLTPANALSYLAAFDHAGLVRNLVDSGFDLIELGGDLGMFFPQAFAPAAIRSLANLQQSRGLTYTVHLPLWSVEPSTPLEPVRRGSIRAIVDIIHATYALQPKAYVCHATGALAAEFSQMRLPQMAQAMILRQFQAGARESLKAILGETGIPGRLLAIETIEFPLDLTLELAEALDLSICLDTGHVLAGFCGPTTLEQALELCLPRLVEVHLHDSPTPGPDGLRQYGRDHQPLGTGDLDVGALLDRLRQADFDGPIILELDVQSALQSLQYIRRVRPQAL
jgi:sugar phosphate isomerase/epimerase